MDREEALLALRGTLDSAGWREVIRPKLEAEIAIVRSQLENAVPVDAVGIAALQTEIRWLRRLLEDTFEFFRPVEDD